MRQKLTILFSVITFTVLGQKNETVNLQWKIGKNEKLNYYTIMSDIDESSFKMDFGGLFKALSDSTNNGLNKSRNFFKEINDAFKNHDFITTLTNKNNGVIDIVIKAKPKKTIKEETIDTTDSKEAEAIKMMLAMTQGIMLRGSVYETGGIHSFWIKSSQKNLIALFFELPAKPVKIGDKWPLDINLISNDQNFICDTSYKLNEVTLADIKQINGETIAVLKYHIVEYVKGDFNTPSFLDIDNEKKKTMMKFSHQGIAEFSIDKGRWINYDGIMSLEATGVMTANKKTKFTLTDEKNTGR